MTRMKQRITCMILLAGLVTMLAGCSEPFNGKTAGQVSFTISAKSSPDTKTAYSGDLITENDKLYERIDWVAGDQIRIYSSNKSQVGVGVVSNVSVPVDSVDHYDYTIGTVTANDRRSDATINKPAEGQGLTWINDPYGVWFYGTYPPLAATYSSDGKLQSFTGMTIPRDQTTTVDMSHAYMLAAPAQFVESTQLDESGNKIPKMHMDFYPAFNAFYIVLGSQKGEIAIDSIKLTTTAADGYLSGSYSYNNPQSQLNNGPIVNGIVYGSDNNNSVKVTLPSGTKIKPGENGAAGDSVKVTLLTLPPQTGTGLTNMVLNVYHDGNTKPASLKLKYNETTNNGAWLTFPAFHKARITGLALNVLPDEIEFKFVVQQWDKTEINISSDLGSINMSNVTWMNTKVDLDGDGVFGEGEESSDFYENTVNNYKYKQTVTMFYNPTIEGTQGGTSYTGYYPAQGYFTVNYPTSGKYKIGLIPAYGETTVDPSKYEIYIYKQTGTDSDNQPVYGWVAHNQTNGEDISNDTVYFQIRAASNQDGAQHKAQIDIWFKPSGSSEWISAYSEIRANYALVIPAVSNSGN